METSANRFRQKRARMIGDLIDRTIAEKGSASVLDIGGTEAYWLALPSLWRGKPVKVTITNLEAGTSGHEQFEHAAANACDMAGFADGQFDLVHSNSVIEHVGHWEAMARMAAEVRRLGRRYYLQTPNLYFPIEPHYKRPMLHWLPESLRAEALRHMKRQLPRDADYDFAMRRVQSINLLTARQLSALFPDGKLVRERLLGFTKSLIVIRD